MGPQNNGYGEPDMMPPSVSDQSGFTLVEVLVTTVILGLLASLAIPVFAVYKTQAFNTKADSDLHNAITAEEANFDATNNYVSCGPSDCGAVLPGFSPSSGVSIVIEVTDQHFSVAACHDRGDKTYAWDSESGDYATAAMGAACEPIPPPIS